MCDCISEITLRLKTDITEKILKKDEGFIKLESANFAHRILALSGSTVNPPSVALDFEYEYLRKLKNGKEKIKKDSINMLPSFCPFCGKPYGE